MVTSSSKVVFDFIVLFAQMNRPSICSSLPFRSKVPETNPPGSGEPGRDRGESDGNC